MPSILQCVNIVGLYPGEAPHATLFALLLFRYLEENVGALAVQLTPEDLKELEAAFPQEKVSQAQRMVHGAAAGSPAIVAFNAMKHSAWCTGSQWGCGRRLVVYHSCQGGAKCA